MKKLILLLSLLVFSISYGNAQTDFKWDRIDSIAKSKEQLYSDTKLFLAEKWNNSKAVIQVDDKAEGIIAIKGTYTYSYMSGVLKRFVYSYSIKFMFKDGKVRVVIDNVTGQLFAGGTDMGSVLVSDSYPEENGKTKTGGVREAHFLEIMAGLKSHIQGIVDLYLQEIKKPSKQGSDW